MRINLSQLVTLLALCTVQAFVSRGYPTIWLAQPPLPTQCLRLSSESEQTATAWFRGYQQPETKRGAFEAARRDAADQGFVLPCIILVNPFLDQNVGSVSRAMLNFGLTELRVVDPRCDINSEAARALASGSVEILENAKVFATLEEAIVDLERVMATTIRPRHMTQLVLNPSAAAKAAVNREAVSVAATTTTKCGIVFGRERSGLTNEEVALADTIVTIPTYSKFSSINLAQACNIMCFELWKRQIELEGVAPPEEWLHPRDGERMSRREDIDSLCTRLEALLTARNYQADGNRREINYRNIRNILQRTLTTKSEIDLLQGVLSSLSKSPI